MPTGRQMHPDGGESGSVRVIIPDFGARQRGVTVLSENGWMKGLVGAPRFELGTPSPPDQGAYRKSLGNFANGLPFGRPRNNELGPALQTG